MSFITKTGFGIPKKQVVFSRITEDMKNAEDQIQELCLDVKDIQVTIRLENGSKMEFTERQPITIHSPPGKLVEKDPSSTFDFSKDLNGF